MLEFQAVRCSGGLFFYRHHSTVFRPAKVRLCIANEPHPFRLLIPLTPIRRENDRKNRWRKTGDQISILRISRAGSGVTL
jgi:hypothetical protein